MSLSVLTVCEFDPCGVHLRHRRHLRALGVDYRLAVRDVYWTEGTGADWYCRTLDPNGITFTDHSCDFGSLRAFAETADVIQFLPGIGQPWSYQTVDPRLHDDADTQPFGPIDWAVTGKQAKLVAVIHGSWNVQQQPHVYAQYYRSKGFEVAATTLDYVHRIEATYLPAIVETMLHAPLREDGQRLAVVHAPTDPRNCGTHDFANLLSRVGSVDVHLIHGVPHDDCLAVKGRCHAGYDHLRGSFSVNSLENAALGLVNFVAVKQEYRDYLKRMGVTLPWPKIETLADLAEILALFARDVGLTRQEQLRARAWFPAQWSPEVNAKRLLRTYEEWTK